MEEQTSIFEMLYPTYKFTKPVRLIELFAGYGSQALALKYLGVEFEHWRICEWAVKSIQAYKDMHYADVNDDYSSMLLKDNIVEGLYKLGISSNYNEPMTREQIARLNEKQLRTIWNNIVITKNLVNVQQTKGFDLEIKDTDKYTYVLSYSFPCQDLSNAGLRKGMSDTTTRSGMLWEVERILSECKELGELPEVLLMENVPMVHSTDNVEDFNKWQLRLEELGYKNYWQDLMATDYEIPQTRNRTFMVSILGDYNYTFPKPIKLEKKLKDMLEDNVDEKYFLSEKAMNYITSTNDKYKVNENNLVVNREIACTKTTREGCTRAGYIDTYNRKVDEEKSGTITTGVSSRNHTFLAIKNATEKGYLEAEEGDGVDISSRMEYHRGTVQKGKTQTLSTMGGENNGVVVDDKHYKKVNEVCDRLLANNEIKESDTILTNFITRRDKENDLVVNNNITPTLTTSATEIAVCVSTNDKDSVYSDSEKALFTEDGNIRRYMNSDIIDQFEEGQMATTTYPNGYGHGPRTHNESVALNTIDKPSVKHNLRIRKLTPRECFRLMGVKDEDFDNVKRNQSDSSLYHLAGDSIVVNVLEAIFKQMI